MSMLESLKAAMPFLDSTWFSYLYASIVMINPFAMLPQLVKTIRANPDDLRGLSLGMFFVYLIIQIMVTFGAIKMLDAALFTSMFLSAIVTSLVIYFTYQKQAQLR